MSKIGWLLVLGQFTLMIAAGVLGVQAWPLPAASLVMLGLSLIVFVLAWVALGSSFTPHPLPNQKGLRTGGIYRTIRHPMYLALLLAAVGIALAEPLTWFAAAGLAAIVATKIVIEEQALAATYPEYEQYAARTKRLLPGIW
jgi:protein-S-isoprenylcysteine O-methyltransferase Ste14